MMELGNVHDLSLEYLFELGGLVRELQPDSVINSGAKQFHPVSLQHQVNLWVHLCTTTINRSVGRLSCCLIGSEEIASDEANET